LPEEDLELIKNKLKEHEERIKYLEGLIDKKSEKPLKKLSLREFLDMKQPNDDVKKTLGICYFLEIYEGMESFNKDDIEEGFRMAKEKVPGNINYKVFRNIEKGYLMETKDKKNNLKAWTLTNSGIGFSENSFKKKKNK